MTGLCIAGLGTALPPHFIQQAEAADIAGSCLAGEADPERGVTLVKALYRRSGVKSRHSVVLKSSSNSVPARQSFYWPSQEVLNRGPGTAQRMLKYEKEAPELALPALTQALQQSGIAAADITHLVTVSCSGFNAPGFDLQLIHSLQLPPTVARTHVGFMGCHAALNGLRVAHAFANADPHAVVAVCAVELCTLHHQYGWDPQEIVANSLFADGAAAVICCGSESSRSAGFSEQPKLVDSFSTIIPDTQEMMSWRIADAGFRMTLSPEVPDIITQFLPAAIDELLSRNQLCPADIDGWAIHPGGPRILQACQTALDLSDAQMEPSRKVLSECGNMSSPTVLFVLQQLLERETSGPIVMLGFGPGLNVEIALLR